MIEFRRSLTFALLAMVAWVAPAGAQPDFTVICDHTSPCTTYGGLCPGTPTDWCVDPNPTPMMVGWNGDTMTMQVDGTCASGTCIGAHTSVAVPPCPEGGFFLDICEPPVPMGVCLPPAGPAGAHTCPTAGCTPVSLNACNDMGPNFWTANYAFPWTGVYGVRINGSDYVEFQIDVSEPAIYPLINNRT